jgi:hypothetical protein
MLRQQIDQRVGVGMARRRHIELLEGGADDVTAG